MKRTEPQWQEPLSGVRFDAIFFGERGLNAKPFSQ